MVGTLARDQGFTIEHNENLLPPKLQSPENVSSHDTLAVIAVDVKRHIAAGTFNITQIISRKCFFERIKSSQ